MNEAISALLNLVADVHPAIRVGLAALAIFLETSFLVGLVMPGDTVVFVAATSVRSAVDFVSLAGAVTIGALLGESFGFWLGRKFGRRVRDSRLGTRFVGSWWGVAEGYISRRGGVAVFISRFLPVLHSVVPLVCGMSNMRYRTFIAWTAPACIAWTALYVSAGFLLAEQFEVIKSTFTGAGWVFIAGVVVFALAIHFGKKWISRRELKGNADESSR